jgi:hypothetical protein
MSTCLALLGKVGGQASIFGFFAWFEFERSKQEITCF